MQCVRCNGKAGYNRAVIELYSGTTVGVLCMSCEKDEFGRTLEYSNRGQERQCTFCQRDGYVMFPRYLPKLETANDKLVVRSTIEGDETTPCLCDEHFHAVVGDDASLNRVEP